MVNAKGVIAALTAMIVLSAALLGCADSDLQTGTYVGWNATLQGDDTPRYMIELEDGTKIMAASDNPAPKEGEEVTVRQLDNDTWEIVSDE